MNLTLVPVLFAIGMFLGMLLLLEIGHRLGTRRLAREGEGARAGLGAVEGAIFGVMGLLIAFTFSGAASRLDTRRAQIVQEANAIGTAWLRLDMLPASAQPALREKFKLYVDSRIETFRKVPDMAAVRAEMARSTALQNEIWAQAAAACKEAPPPVMGLVLPALDGMIDASATRDGSFLMHPPPIVFIMLGVLVLASALLSGYGMATAKSKSWFHILAFVAIMAVTVYVIIDLEFPRLGLLRIDLFDRVMVDLRQSMNR